MVVDRIIGILGLIFSVAGLVSIPKFSVAWLVLIIGVVCIVWSIYSSKRRSFKLLKSVLEYEFSDRSRKRVKCRKITILKVVKPNVTRIQSGYLRGSGKLNNFTSNLGRITVEYIDGGQINVNCDLDESLQAGSVVEWVLAYDMVNSFGELEENVTMTAHVPGNIGILYLKFSPKDVPSKIWRTISTLGSNPKSESIKVNTERPEIFWQFKIKFRNYYSIYWEWPDYKPVDKK